MDKTTLIRYAKSALILFIALFAIQSAYQALKSHPEGQGFNEGIFEGSRKNYASYKKGMEKAIEIAPQAKQTTSPDRYEKIARMSSRTSAFEDDRKRLTDALSKQNAVIQFESLKGLNGNRTYYLSAGVPPDSFDQTVEQLRTIGRPASLSIEKTDRTSDYLALLEKRASLERTKASLLALKSRGGSMDEFLKLENRLLEIEEQLRGTNLGIGQYNAENEFCTVQFTLHETQGWTFRKAGHILVDAFLWTVALAVMLVFLAGSTLAGIWILLAIRNRLRRDQIRGPNP